MILNIDFDSLDTFNAEYGASSLADGKFKIYLEAGLVIRDEIPDVFPWRYIYDPWKGVKYDRCELVDGVLRAHVDNRGGGEDEWVDYHDEYIIKRLPEYIYYGKCWFVFCGVKFASMAVSEYGETRESFTGVETEEVFGEKLEGADGLTEYVLEGVLHVPPGPGWMHCVVQAESFHIEIPDA